MFEASPSPLYAQLETTLADRIVSGELPPASRLPSEDVLSVEFGVSRTTVRATIQRLIQRGLVEIRRGKGTYVTPPKLTMDLSQFTSFVQDMEANGRTASAHVLRHQTVAADDIVAKELGVAPGTMVKQIIRLRLADGVPVSYDVAYLSLRLGQKVLKADLTVLPIFDVLEQQCGVRLVGANYRVEASSADATTATALRIAQGSPIFYIERTCYRLDGKPVEFERLYFRGDRIRFQTYLPRKRPGGRQLASKG